jgi:hypothetical protein
MLAAWRATFIKEGHRTTDQGDFWDRGKPYADAKYGI